MAIAAQFAPEPLAIEEYLQTAYHPDCDFVDGYLEERNVGETKHGLLQVEVAFWFRSHKREWNIRAVSELRTRVSRTRVRLPDIAVVLEDEALAEEVRLTPPLIAIEILSRKDRFNRVTVRLADFLSMGIPNIWLLDPMSRVAYTFDEQGLHRVDSPRITLPNSPIYVDLPELFSCLD